MGTDAAKPGESGHEPPVDAEVGSTTSLLAGQIDPVYQAKIDIVNAALEEINTGRWLGPYQRHLFVVAGFGWFNDNVGLKSRETFHRPNFVKRFGQL